MWLLMRPTNSLPSLRRNTDRGRGDWRLVDRGNGQRMADEMISKETCSKGWRTLTIDLTKFADQELKLDLVNQANDWSNEFGYRGGVQLLTD